MNLTAFLNILWRRKWIIMLTVVVTVAVVAAQTSAAQPLYKSCTVMRVSTSTIGSFEFLQYDITYTDRLMNTYSHMATSSPVMQRLMDTLNLQTPPTIEAAPVEDTELLTLCAEHTDPIVAADSATALSTIVMDEIENMRTSGGQPASEILRAQLDQTQEELDELRAEYSELASLYADTDERVVSANRAMLLKEQMYASLLDQYETARTSELARATTLQVVEPAWVPQTPSSPNVPLNLGLGALVGLAAGLALAVVFENVDSTLYTSRAIEQAIELDVLGVIPQGRGQKVLTFTNGSSPQAEAYRSLRTTLFGMHNDGSLRSLMFTSAVPNEGKSTVVANLAYAIAQTGRTVIAVDCDLRRPTLDKLFGVSSDVGLINLLRREVNPWEAMVHTDHPNLTLITTGMPLPGNPSEVLSSMPIADVLETLLQRADIVLVDAPALGRVTDAAVVAPLVDASVLVVGRGHVKQEEVQLAYRRLVQAKARNVGVIINRAEAMPSHSY